MSDRTFRVYFNRRKQWFDVVLHEVTPSTFQRHDGGRWGYWQEEIDRKSRRGKFGELHCVKSRCRHDVIAHELLHLWIDWLNAKGIIITAKNEEPLVLLYDELVRHFWKEYERTNE